MFFEISQNNSGGSFHVDDKVCHRLFIEADGVEDAISKAEDLGCYWDGCDSGYDCPCCGDRWHQPYSAVDLDETNKKWGGYSVSKFTDISISEFKSLYPNSVWSTEPKKTIKYGSNYIEGVIRLDSIEQYAQIMAILYGWTKPDCRIFYKDGRVVEIYKPE